MRSQKLDSLVRQPRAATVRSYAGERADTLLAARGKGMQVAEVLRDHKPPISEAPLLFGERLPIAYVEWAWICKVLAYATAPGPASLAPVVWERDRGSKFLRFQKEGCSFGSKRVRVAQLHSRGPWLPKSPFQLKWAGSRMVIHLVGWSQNRNSRRAAPGCPSFPLFAGGREICWSFPQFLAELPLLDRPLGPRNLGW